MCRDENGLRGYAAERQGLELVLRFIRGDSPGAEAPALFALGNLCGERSIVDAALRAGALEAVVAAVDAAATAARSTGSPGGSDGDDLAAAVSRASAAAATAAAARAEGDEEELAAAVDDVSEALAALAGVGHSSGEGAEPGAGDDAVLNTDKEDPESFQVPRFALSALANLCAENPEAKRAAIRLGALRSTCALLHDVQDASVVANGLMALGNLCDAPEAGLDEGMLAHEVLDLAVGALVDFPEDVEIQTFALALLGNLCDGRPDLTRYVADGGVPDCLSTSLRLSADAAGEASAPGGDASQRHLAANGRDLAEAAICGAMDALCQGGGDVERRVLGQDTVLAVASVLKAYPSEPRVQAYGKRLLGRAETPESKLRRLAI